MVVNLKNGIKTVTLNVPEVEPETFFSQVYEIYYEIFKSDQEEYRPE